jgi:multidrug efflux pump subunit AcrA (membrane-fusion protein)
MATPLFRQEAIQHAAAGERYEDVFVVVSARAWLALAAVGALLVATLLWSIFASIPVTVDGSGELVAGSGVQTIVAPSDGVVTAVGAVGAAVSRGDAVVRVRSGSDTIAVARAPIAGTVIEVAVIPSSYVHRGDVIATIEPPLAQLQAIVFVPVSAEQAIVPGMAARVSPIDANPKVYGVIRGYVSSVAPYPASPDRIKSVFHNDALAAGVMTRPVREVHVALERDADGSPRWSGFPRNRPRSASGTPCSAGIVVENRRPIAFVFPALE